MRPFRLLPALLLLVVSPVAAVAAPGGRVVINYWEKWTGFEAAAMQSIVDDFNRSQDRVEVRFLSITPIDVKLLLAASSGHPPDVAGLWEYDIPEFAEKGALLPLDQAIAAAGLGPDHYIPIYWDLCRYRGFTWALPSTPGCVALYYNKRLFREAGLDPDRPPRTLAEVDAMSRRLTRVDVVRDGHRVNISFDQLTPAERTARHYAITQIGHLPSDAGMFASAWGYWFGAKYYDGDRHILANDAGNLAAFRWMRDIVLTYGLDQLRDFGASFGVSQSARPPFLAGASAMVMQGPWYPNFIRKYAPDLEWGVAPFPAAPGVSDHAPMTLVVSDMLVIPRGAPHPKEAFEFIRYVQRQAVAEKLARLQRKFTALSHVSPGFFVNHPNPAIRFFANLARSPGARAVPRIGIWRDYDTEMSIAAQRVRSLEASPEQALAEVQKRMQWQEDRAMRRWDLIKTERMAEWRQYEHW
ncbi:MAG TPA: ABC transporter substrate-binding protein [Opitutaceae bacterium]|nr:ABC transporter substrate-binding protein [Opitutaceae bacterium]